MLYSPVNGGCLTLAVCRQSDCEEVIVSNNMVEIVATAASTCPRQPQSQEPQEAQCPDEAELCRGWGFHWDDNRKTCVAGGH